MKDYAITLEQALDRLTLRDPVEIRFECRPNSGETFINHRPRAEVVEMLTIANANGIICEGGRDSQTMDFGIYIGCRHPEYGLGVVFIQTRPEKRIAPGDLIRREQAEQPHRQ